MLLPCHQLFEYSVKESYEGGKGIRQDYYTSEISLSMDRHSGGEGRRGREKSVGEECQGTVSHS